MAEPTITCPNCKTEIKLNESLAGPLLEATRRDFEKRLKQKDIDLAATLKEEATKIAVEEARKAKLALSNELEQKPAPSPSWKRTLPRTTPSSPKRRRPKPISCASSVSSTPSCAKRTCRSRSESRRASMPRANRRARKSRAN